MPKPTIHRRKRYEVLNQPRFLTFSCYRRLALFNNDSIKRRFIEYLEDAQHDLSFELIAWVLMPEHAHLLLTPDLPDHPVPDILERVKRDFACEVLRHWRKHQAPILNRITTPAGTSHFWQRGGGYDRNIRDEQELRAKCDYIHDNPCKRGLAKTPIDWRWSSARYFAGKTDHVLEV